MATESDWTAHLAELDLLVDRLGRQIDSGVREVVAAFRAHEFPTVASCEGHLYRGHPYPWIEVCFPRRAQEADAAWMVRNTEARLALGTLMDTFYRHREDVPFDVRLCFRDRPMGSFRVQSAGGAAASVTPRLAWAKLIQYREEIGAFAMFLKRTR